MAGDTYTYVAEAAREHGMTATLILRDSELAVELDPDAMRALRAGPGAAKADTLVDRIIQWFMRPFPLNEVTATANDNGLMLTAWTRAGGLRLAPVIYGWQELKDPAGGRAFVAELYRRRSSAPAIARLPGPLDYWVTWIAVATTGMMALASVLRRLRRSAD